MKKWMSMRFANVTRWLGTARRSLIPPALSIGILLGLAAIIASSSYKPSTWLTGWDNLHPEFDFRLNITRSLFSTWKNFQGLGAVSGIGLSADLPRQLILLLLSTVVPTHDLRFFWTLCLLALGPLGMYALTKYIFLRKSSRWRELTAFFAGAYYLLNFGTIQQFYTPFETFTTQYGFFPWLLLAFFLFLKRPTWKRTAFLAFVSLLITPMGYVPTVFITTLLSVGIFLLHHLIQYPKKAHAIGAVIAATTLFLVLQLHWLSPFLYYVATQGDSTARSTINTFASIEAKLSNTEYGRWRDVVILRGFWYEYVDPDTSNAPTYLMQPWREHLSQPLVTLLGYFFFACILLGIYQLWKEKHSLLAPIVALFFLTIFMLKSYNQPFGILFQFLSDHVPFFGEIFRYTFTKWLGTAILIYALLFSFGCRFFLTGLDAVPLKRVATALFSGLMFSYLIFFVYPVFQGQLFSTKNQLAIPTEYFQVMEYFRSQPKEARIATFPQYTIFGWNIHTWGYRGSGWWRHGIEQPLLERTHDVWSEQNEQYYNQISRAVYSEDTTLFADTIHKYSVGWLLVDNSLNYGSDKHLTELAFLIRESGLFQEPVTFGMLTIYPKKDVAALASSYLQPPTTHQFALQNTTTVEKKTRSVLEERALETLRSDERSYTYELPLGFSAPATLTLADPLSSEAYLPASLTLSWGTESAQVAISPELPRVKIDGKPVPLSLESTTSALPVQEDTTRIAVQVNADPPVFFEKNSEEKTLKTYLLTKDLNTLRVFDATEPIVRDLSEELRQAPSQSCAQGESTGTKSVVGESFSFTVAQGTLCSSTVTNTPSSSLLQLQFEGKSATTEKPFVVAKSTVDQRFLDKLTPTDFSSPVYEPYETFFLAPNTATRSASLTTQPSQLERETENTESIEIALGLSKSEQATSSSTYSLRNSTLTQYPLVSSITYQLPSLNEQGRRTEIPAGAKSLSVEVSSDATFAPATTLSRLSHSATALSKGCNELGSTAQHKIVTQDGILYRAWDSTLCDVWHLPKLGSAGNYILGVESTFISGKPLFACLSYSKTGRCDVFALQPITSGRQKVLYPVFAKSFVSQSYAVQINAHSIGREKTESALHSLSLKPFPFSWLEASTIESSASTLAPASITWSKSYPFGVYLLTLQSQKNDQLITLSQAFDTGWIAFVYHNRPPYGLNNLLSHVTADGWMDGWIFPGSTDASEPKQVIVLFYPTLFQFIGWLCLVTIVLFLLSNLLISWATQTWRRLKK